ncbi:MAG TPA: histidine--tRNA ligase [Saprospiraceae bacterium]|nr:histidine--tRNA ligase [Saprospiraceae bacterium]
MKPGIPKGTRDFGPEQVLKRNYIFDTIKQVFIKYGYQPIETPTIELLSTLTGKYGEEGDRLLFRVLKRGDKLAKSLENQPSANDLAEEGLRYDLTVPFARYVVMNQQYLTFPFKRYQIQPVWRADRPQRGRYREFYQCDVDVIGSGSLIYEAEFAQIFHHVFTKLGIDVIIKINNRKILAGIAEVAGISEQFVDMTIAIDKLDKIGIEGVRQEMQARGIPANAIDKVAQLLQIATPADLKPLLASSATGAAGIEEVAQVFDFLETSTTQEVQFDVTLARGLNYYTGCIFEVQAKNVQMGSIGGGGRYDDLTGIFGLKGVSGVGVSFGAERIYDVMEELQLFPSDTASSLQILFIAFDATTHRFAFQCLQSVRAAGIHAELYPDPGNLKKQMKYANSRHVPYVALIGEAEMTNGQLTLKDMVTGEQASLLLTDIILKIQRRT